MSKLFKTEFSLFYECGCHKSFFLYSANLMTHISIRKIIHDSGGEKAKCRNLQRPVYREQSKATTVLPIDIIFTQRNFKFEDQYFNISRK